MELAILLETLARIPNRNKTLVGSGVALGEMQTPITRTGAVKEIACSPHDHNSLLEMMMQWTSLWFERPPQTKKKKNIAVLVDVSNVENKAISHETVPIKQHEYALSK